MYNNILCLNRRKMKHALRDSNPRHAVLETAVLPTELRTQINTDIFKIPYCDRAINEKAICQAEIGSIEYTQSQKPVIKSWVQARKEGRFAERNKSHSARVNSVEATAKPAGIAFKPA
jgi:hypothetical protein